LADCFTVYKHISPNGKQYVGITSLNVETRWNNGNNYRNNPYFTNAIKKYGWDNFEHIILYENLSKVQACEIEKKLIKELDLTNSNKGYNLTFGGEHGKMSDQTKKKISHSLKGNQFRRGIPHTKETIQKTRETRAGKNPHEWTDESRKKLSNSKKGVKASKETKEKLSIIRRGKNNSFYGKHHSKGTKELLRQINIGKKHTNEARQKMSEKRKGVKLSKEHSQHIGDGHKKPLIQMTLSGDFVKEWDSVKSASEAHNNLKHIDGVCRGERKSAGDYKWIYKEGYHIE